MTNGVLFLCLGNSCRSIMAEGLARYAFPDSLKIASAGLNPLGFVAPETLQVLAEWGIPTANLRSKGLEEINGTEFPLIVNLTSDAVESHLPRNFHGRIIHYPVADPFGNTLEAYRQARDAIHRFVAEDLPQHLAGFEGQPGSQPRKPHIQS
jgi:protein-tyrosine-phosphatase